MELNDVLSPTELQEMLAAAHKPSYVSWRLSTYLAAFGKSHRSATCKTRHSLYPAHHQWKEYTIQAMQSCNDGVGSDLAVSSLPA